jgi:transaldolase
LTANLAQIKEASVRCFRWVTTNPSLMAKENYRKNSILKHYVDICNLVDGDVSAEVNLIMTE